MRGRQGESGPGGSGEREGLGPGVAMWAGCYVLYLYCDNAKPCGADGLDEHGHTHGEFPVKITGELGSACRSSAKRAGWLLGLRGQVLCPKCSGKAPQGGK